MQVGMRGRDCRKRDAGRNEGKDCRKRDAGRNEGKRL